MSSDQPAEAGVGPMRSAEHLYGQFRIELIAALPASGAAAAAAYASGRTAIAAGFLLGLAVLYAGRALLVRSFQRSAQVRALHPSLAGRDVRVFVVGMALVGLLWGALGASLLAPEVFTSFAVVLTAAALFSVYLIAVYTGHVGTVAAFAVPSVLAPGAAFALLQSQTGVTVAALAVATATVVLLAALRVRQVGLTLTALEGDNARMQRHLDERREQVDKLTVALKTHAEKHENAEAALRRAAADLGLTKGKAKALAETLERVAPYCPVTSLHNRRTLDEHLREEWRRTMREKKPLSLVVAGIDDFDSYVAGYGGQPVEQTLKRIAKLLRATGKRAGDIPARYADGRFALLLPGCDTKNANGIAESLRARIEGLRIPFDGSKVSEVITVHVGVATIIPARGTSETMLRERVETALYEASFQGGNRVVAYRALEKLRLERWSRKTDGPLTEQGLMQKLLIWGFDPVRRNYPAATRLPDSEHEEETVIGVLAGQLQLTIEGQSLVLKSGDCLFVPAGTTISAEVVGGEPAQVIEAARAG